MRTVQTEVRFPLASVKPLERLAAYREHCLTQTRLAFQTGGRRPREKSPVSGVPLEPVGQVEGFTYARCPESGSLFLLELPEPAAWEKLLGEVSRYRHSPEAFHQGLAVTRNDHVHFPKLEWIQETLRLQGVSRPRILEVVTPPGDLSALLRECGSFSEVGVQEEMALAHWGSGKGEGGRFQAAILPESLDRVDDPAGLLQGVRSFLSEGGLLFVTALVSSGFDMEALGLRNRYLYPPDRTNCFSLEGLKRLLEQAGFTLLEASTPGVLDVEIVQAHLQADPSLPLTGFERQVVLGSPEVRQRFQAFLQETGLSSFARLAARRR